MKTLTLKLPEPLERKLVAAVARRGVQKSVLVRRALEAYLSGDMPPSEDSVLARIGDLAGCVAGPADLSTHPRHLKDFGK